MKLGHCSGIAAAEARKDSSLGEGISRSPVELATSSVACFSAGLTRMTTVVGGTCSSDHRGRGLRIPAPDLFAKIRVIHDFTTS